MSLSINKRLQPSDIIFMKRFQYYIVKDFKKDFRIIIATLTILLFIIQVRVRRLKAKTLINLGVTRNFINEEFARKINYKKEILKKPYDLSMFNGTPLIYNNNKIIYHSKKIRLQIDGFKERRSFDIIYLRGLDLILRLL